MRVVFISLCVCVMCGLVFGVRPALDDPCFPLSLRLPSLVRSPVRWQFKKLVLFARSVCVLTSLPYPAFPRNTLADCIHTHTQNMNADIGLRSKNGSRSSSRTTTGPQGTTMKFYHTQGRTREVAGARWTFPCGHRGALAFVPPFTGTPRTAPRCFRHLCRVRVVLFVCRCCCRSSTTNPPSLSHHV